MLCIFSIYRMIPKRRSFLAYFHSSIILSNSKISTPWMVFRLQSSRSFPTLCIIDLQQCLMFLNQEGCQLKSWIFSFLMFWCSHFSPTISAPTRDIAKDLRMATLTLRQIFEHLGCKLISSQKVSYGTLPIPLTFPQTRQRKKKNKNKLWSLSWSVFVTIDCFKSSCLSVTLMQTCSDVKFYYPTLGVFGYLVFL